MNAFHAILIAIGVVVLAIAADIVLYQDIPYNGDDYSEATLTVEVHFNDGSPVTHDTIEYNQQGGFVLVVESLQTWAYDDPTVDRMTLRRNGQTFWSFSAYD